MVKVNALKSTPGARPMHGTRDIQIIRDSRTGEPAFAVLPWADYERLSGGGDDEVSLIAAADAARGDATFPEDIARRLVAGEVPLKVFREWRKLTQSELGGKSRVPSQYISQLERRARSMGKSVAKKLAEALDVPADMLMDL